MINYIILLFKLLPIDQAVNLLIFNPVLTLQDSLVDLTNAINHHQFLYFGALVSNTPPLWDMVYGVGLGRVYILWVSENSDSHKI